MESDVAPNPFQVRLLGWDRVVEDADARADLIQHAGLGGGLWKRGAVEVAAGVGHWIWAA